MAVSERNFPLALGVQVKDLEGPSEKIVTALRIWLLEQGTSNIGYLDPLGKYRNNALWGSRRINVSYFGPFGSPGLVVRKSSSAIALILTCSRNQKIGTSPILLPQKGVELRMHHAVLFPCSNFSESAVDLNANSPALRQARLRTRTVPEPQALCGLFSGHHLMVMFLAMYGIKPPSAKYCRSVTIEESPPKNIASIHGVLCPSCDRCKSLGRFYLPYLTVSPRTSTCPKAPFLGFETLNNRVMEPSDFIFGVFWLRILGVEL